MCVWFHGTMALSELELTFSDVAGSLTWGSIVFHWDCDFRITDQFKPYCLSFSFSSSSSSSSPFSSSSPSLWPLFSLEAGSNFVAEAGFQHSCFSFPGMEIIGLQIVWLFLVNWLNVPVFQLPFMAHVKKTTNQQVSCKVFRSSSFYFF